MQDQPGDSFAQTMKQQEPSSMLDHRAELQMANTVGFQHSPKKQGGGARIKVAVRIRPLLDSEQN